MEEGEEKGSVFLKDMTIRNNADITDNRNETQSMESLSCTADEEITIENKVSSECTPCPGSHLLDEQNPENVCRVSPREISLSKTESGGGLDITREDDLKFVLKPSNPVDDKENINGTVTSESTGISTRKAVTDDEETVRRAREEGRVDVIFPGYVTQDGCCRFVCEILKCVLYQRQQLPMTYDQLVYFQRQHQASTQTDDAVGWRPTKVTGGLDWRRCQRTLQELDEVLGHLETLFSLSHVPRVLFVLGGSVVLPNELYEVNMEALALEAGEGSLRVSVCLRQLFRTLFVADLLSDARPVRLMTTTVMALGHRDCGVDGFRPKLDFRVPTKVKRQVISLACDSSLAKARQADVNWEDYIWFQAPVTIKGFCK
ncbi:MAD2L1-binding protein [Chanos chanos]|uniref:MAD2L1-binding protein n=1 Tax=Chanos chanos TaxID=29144 RepID=A0A6J2VAG6_CHACN|nr:MAD2L1-binding protein [Chanos chanos]